MEFFVPPADSEKWYRYWIEERFNWFLQIGIRKEKLKIRPHKPDELAHYAKGCSDVEYEFPFGWSELEGIADRGDYDLSQHMKASGKDLSYFDDESKQKYVPAVVESSLGVDRTFLTLLADAYHEEEAPTAEEGETEKRVVMRFHPSIAPVTIAFLPLAKKIGEPLHKIEQGFRKNWNTEFDAVGSIGKRYRRHDEIGTPYCVTFDFESEKDQKVTVRDRDSMKQDRIAISQLENYLKERLP